jgi:hypothetical protein
LTLADRRDHVVTGLPLQPFSCAHYWKLALAYRWVTVWPWTLLVPPS